MNDLIRCLLPALTVLAILPACGSADFSGSSSTPTKTGKEPPPSTNNVNAAMRLTWLWPCEGRDITVSGASKNHLIISGPGPHRLDADKLKGAQVSVKGATCGAEQKQREIVFAVDVSGSMRDTDNVVGGTCHRLKAIEEVIAAVKGQDVKFGIATFSDAMAATYRSTELYATKEELFSDLVSKAGGTATIRNIICANMNGTDYGVPLLDARYLFTSGDDKLRELYFVSDGEPDPVQNNGQTEADELKGNGISIATVMIGNKSDAFLKKIASEVIAAHGNKRLLHAKIDQAEELAAVLAKFADNRIESGSFLFGGAGRGKKAVDLTKKLIGSIFAFDAFKIDPETSPEGLEVELQYVDRFGGRQKTEGKIEWLNPD